MTDTPTPPPSRRVSASDVQGLRQEVAGLRHDLYGDDEGDETGGIIGFLRTGYRGNRWRIRLIILSLCLDLILTVAVFTSAVGANSSCDRSNQQRAAQRALWDHVLDLSSAGREQTPQEKQTAAQFRAYVNRQFRPIDCSFWAHL